jgi:hypothetical protein
MTLWTPPRSLAIPSGGNGGCGVFADADIIHVGNPAGLWPNVPGVWFLVDVAKLKIHKAIDSAATEWYSRRFSSFTYNEAPFGDYLFPQTTIRYRDTKIIGSKEDVFNDGTSYRSTQLGSTIISVWGSGAGQPGVYNIRRSSDGGASFSSKYSFGSSSLNAIFWRPIATATGKLLLFADDNAYDLLCFSSTDNGISWALESTTTYGAWPATANGSPVGAIVDGSNIYAIVYNSSVPRYRLFVSTDDGASFSYVGASSSVFPLVGAVFSYFKIGSLFIGIGAWQIWSSSDLLAWTDRSTANTSTALYYDGYVYRVKSGSRKIERTSDFSAWSDFSEIRTVPASGLTPYAGSVKAVLSREDGVFTASS